METLKEKSAISSRILKTELINWRELNFIQNDNFKELSEEAKHKLKASIVSNNFMQPFYVWEDENSKKWCLDGKHRTLLLEALINDGIKVPLELPATFIECKSKKDAAKLVLLFSSQYAKVTEIGFSDFIKLNELNLEEFISEIDLPSLDMSFLDPETEEYKKEVFSSLKEKFIVPPFSVLDTRQGYWQDRKRKWNEIGLSSQETREDIEIVSKSGQGSAVYELKNEMRSKLKREPDWDEVIAEAKKRGLYIYEGASIFDPVLCEVCYTWFAPKNGKVLDPFAGGSVRGIIASSLDLDYCGIDLRKDQVEANYRQSDLICKGNYLPKWLIGDSNKILDEVIDSHNEVDFVFSCPPYHDLEKYSDDKDDLSNMSYEEFLDIYQKIIIKAVSRLKQNRFACFVVGDIRDKSGFYKNFVSDTIDCFKKCTDENGNNIELYNEIILVNVAGSLPMRIGKQFGGYRKVGKMHQNVLVFYKGDPKKIKEDFPIIDLSNTEEKE